mgnify:CR=1 FL=1
MRNPKDTDPNLAPVNNEVNLDFSPPEESRWLAFWERT